ncbi:hypothetical protein [Ruminococcus sp. Marseille-P6503]|uniref:hypothetical protein n=1 Tax=Ruminococcus sp. Marseille-P6503 TaxID=2364796 RepID=UPI000F53D398|nr:hypothetical protein [Ruminococcus sp. Marseille-P6503]
MSAAIISVVKKIAIYILSDKEKRGKFLVIVGSIIAGVLGLMFLPVAVLSSMGNMEIEQPQIDKSLFNESAIMASMDSEQQAKIDEIQTAGQEIEIKMSEKNIREQTIKAQLIYFSYFESSPITDFEVYTNLFATAASDEILLDSIKANYGIEIPYEDFMRSYTLVMNSTINEYMFSDSTIKNCADLAAWAENAYISGWGYMNGFIGERNESDRIRYCDNAGLMLGYLNYDPTKKVFGSDYDTLVYTEQGGLDTMPEVAGVGLFDETNHGIYIGNGEVIYCSETVGYVTKDLVSNGNWTSWCTYESVNYSQEVQDKIDEIQNVEEESSDEKEDDVE